MARPTAKGFPYFNLDSDIFFSDRNIKALMGRYGVKVMCLYIYILCEVYRQEGYYCCYDDVFVGCAASQLGMTCGEVEDMLSSLIERALFDKSLFESKGILTSHGIQKRFQEMGRERGRKNELIIDSDFWILNSTETEKYVTFNSGNNPGFSGNNQSFSGNNDDNSRNNPPKVKESKEKKNKENESKVNESISTDPSTKEKKVYGTFKNVYLTDEEYNNFKNSFPNDHMARINLLSFGIESKGYTYKSHYAALLQWEANSQKNKMKQASKPKNSFHNFEQRPFDPNEFDDIYFAELKADLARDSFDPMDDDD